MSPNPLVSGLFVLLTAGMYFLLGRTFQRAVEETAWSSDRKRKYRNWVLILPALWTIFISILAATGFLANFSNFPPPIMIVLVVPLVSTIYFTFHASTRELLMLIPRERLIQLQTFRIAVELILWQLYTDSVLPVQMTFEGRNFDVLAGLTAIPAALLLAKSRVGLIVWNILSLGLLINIITVAILSLPTPFRYFMNEPANTIVATFPFVWLPGLLVPLAYGLHFLSLRQLTLDKSN